MPRIPKGPPKPPRKPPKAKAAQPTKGKPKAPKRAPRRPKTPKAKPAPAPQQPSNVVPLEQARRDRATRGIGAGRKASPGSPGPGGNYSGAAGHGNGLQGSPDTRGEETVQDRIEMILDMLITGNWNGKVSLRALARRWGVAESTVKNYKAEASHRAKAMDDPEKIGETREQTLMMLRRQAQQFLLGDPANGIWPDRKAWLRTQRLIAEVAGLMNYNQRGKIEAVLDAFLKLAHSVLDDENFAKLEQAAKEVMMQTA